MNKEWFIFKGTHHLGPFSLEEMEEFFSVGELTAQSLVWKEGAEKWEALSKTKELAFLLKSPNKKPAMPDMNPKPPAKPKLPDLPPELPELPDLPEDLPPPTPPSFLSQPVVEEEDDMPPPIPLDAILHPNGKRPSFKKEASNFPRILFASLVFVFVVVIAWFFMNEQSSSIQVRVKGVMPAYLDKLQETAAQKTPSIVVSMALSLDGKTLYASTNKDGEILTIIKMQSLPKRILGTDDVELMVRGKIVDHVGRYEKMLLTKGPQFVPGEYNIDFNGRKIHFLNRKFRFLNDISFFKKLNTNYTYHTTALIYAGTPREFEKKLAEYKETIVNEKLKPFTDKLERMQTFLSILNKAGESYLSTLDKMTKPSDIIMYEQTLMKEISPILQSLVVAADDIAKQTEDKELDTRFRVASYRSQIQIGKQLGELAVDMLTQTKKLKKITDKDKATLRAKFEVRYKNLKQQIDAHIAQVQNEINKISN